MANTLPTPQEITQVILSSLLTSLDPSGTGKPNLRTGSKLTSLVSLGTALGSRNASHIAARLAARSISSAVGADLDELVQDLYSDARKPANAAVGTVYIKRSGALPTTTIPKGTRFSVPAAGTTPAITFATTADVPAVAGQDYSAAPLAIAVQCTAADATGNVLVSTVTNIVDPLADATWVIATAPGGADLWLGGGTPEESDEQLRARVLAAALGDSRKRGTLRAIQQGAGQVPGLAFTTAVEPLDGSVIVYAGDLNYQLPSALKTALLTQLEAWRAFGVPIVVRAYNATKVQVTATLYMSRPTYNYNAPSLQAQAVQAVINYFQARPRPDEYYKNAIIAALASVHPEVQDVGLTAPSSSQNRPADSSYGAVATLNRYYVDSSSINVQLGAPQTQ